MEIAMDIIQVGCFDITACLTAMLPNDVHDSKTNPQRMTIRSFTVPKVTTNTEANSEEDADIEPMD